MTVQKDVHGKSRYLRVFFHLFCAFKFSTLKAAFQVSFWPYCLKAAAKHSQKLKPTCVSVLNWCLPTRSRTHKVNTEGLPVFSGGHLGHSFFCTFSLLSVIVVLSSVHPPILFPQAGTEPVWALNTLGITSGQPTQLISRQRVIAGKSKVSSGHE